MTVQTEEEVRRRVDLCLRGQTSPQSTGNRKRLFLFGDSHAGNVFTALQRIAAVNDAYELRWSATGSGCGFIEHALFNPEWFPSGSLMRTLCELYNMEARRVLQSEIRAGDVLVIANHDEKIDDRQIPFLRELRATITHPVGARLVVIGDTPSMRNQAPYCNPNAAQCESSIKKVYVDISGDQIRNGHEIAPMTLNQRKQQIGLDFEDVYFFNLFFLLCTLGGSDLTAPTNHETALIMNRGTCGVRWPWL